MMPSVFVIGCCHDIQGEAVTDSRYVNGHNRLRELIAESFGDRGIDFIAEECDTIATTVAKTFADNHGVHYCAIDVPRDLKAKILHVHPNYFHPADSSQREEFRIYQIAWWLAREYHMYRRFIEDHTGNSALLICGTWHFSRIAGLLLGDGFSVDVRNIDL